MGFAHATITLTNSGDEAVAARGFLPPESVRKTEVRALVDSGASTLVINDTIKNQLGLRVQETAEISLADGSSQVCEIVGPVDIRFKNRHTVTYALVIPTASDVLLGVIPLEGMDVIIDPKTQELALPPERPYLAQFIVR
ncbi:MAG: clan AA aspartic protease [Planctomycetaceae bacterium]|jgi:clan AA aspartic protease|nr:clan AA aspartic protease [Planctomycetaceae bacterium]